MIGDSRAGASSTEVGLDRRRPGFVMEVQAETGGDTEPPARFGPAGGAPFGRRELGDGHDRPGADRRDIGPGLTDPGLPQVGRLDAPEAALPLRAVARIGEVVEHLADRSREAHLRHRQNGCPVRSSNASM